MKYSRYKYSRRLIDDFFILFYCGGLSRYNIIILYNKPTYYHVYIYIYILLINFNKKTLHNKNDCARILTCYIVVSLKLYILLL